MEEISIAKHFDKKEIVVFFEGDCRDLLNEIPDNTIQLVVTSPPYNIGKPYEKKVNLIRQLKRHFPAVPVKVILIDI